MLWEDDLTIHPTGGHLMTSSHSAFTHRQNLILQHITHTFTHTVAHTETKHLLTYHPTRVSLKFTCTVAHTHTKPQMILLQLITKSLTTAFVCLTARR